MVAEISFRLQLDGSDVHQSTMTEAFFDLEFLSLYSYLLETRLFLLNLQVDTKSTNC